MAVVTISEEPLGIEQLLEVVEGTPVELGPGARSRIHASRTVVDEALAGGDPIYGLNTGVGHDKGRPAAGRGAANTAGEASHDPCRRARPLLGD
ncbi:hypothetical protein BH24ACT26_BH24ACT26_06970 [soil metagenome]